MSADASEFVYRPISALAVICLVLSVVTLSSFMTYYMIVPALIVLVMSIVVSLRLDRSNAEYAGQLPAKVAILVGLIATLGAGTAHWVRFIAIQKEAREFADKYLRVLLADDLETAFWMRAIPNVREECKGNVKELVFRHNADYEKFKKEPPTRALRAGDSSTEKARVVFLGTVPLADEEFARNWPILRMIQLVLFGPEYRIDENGLDEVPLKFRVSLANQERSVYDAGLAVCGGLASQGWKGRQWYIKDALVASRSPVEASQPKATRMGDVD